MKKLAILAYNVNCEKEEATLIKYARDFFAQKDIEVMDFEGYDNFDDIVKEAVNEADYLAIAYDALEGMNPNFYRLASYFTDSPVKPYLLITNYDLADVDLDAAQDAFREVWLMERPSLSDYSMRHKTFYYSYDDGFKDADF